MQGFLNKTRKTRKKIRRFRRRILNKKNLTTIIMVLSALALIAGYVLPYIN